MKTTLIQKYSYTNYPIFETSITSQINYVQTFQNPSYSKRNFPPPQSRSCSHYHDTTRHYNHHERNILVILSIMHINKSSSIFRIVNFYNYERNVLAIVTIMRMNKSNLFTWSYM